MKCEYFEIYELVSKEVYEKYGETAWQFFDPRLLITIDWVRESLCKPILINTWYWRGHLSQRGLRENTCDIVAEKTNNGLIYLSAHVLGMGVDFDITGMTSKEFQSWLDENVSNIPYPIRIEQGVKWNHLDVMNNSQSKLYYFK